MKSRHVATPKSQSKKQVKSGMRVRSGVKAGPSRRMELDHVGAYNFMVEISG